MTTERPTVIFLINSFAVGGAERVFVDDMKSLHAEGWRVHTAVLFSLGELAHELGEAGIPVHQLSFSSVFDMEGILRLKRLAHELGATHVLSTLNEANLAGRLAKLVGARYRLLTREANMADIKPWKYKLADILLGTQSEKILAVSHAVGDSVCAYAPWLGSRTVVLYNGTDVGLRVLHRKSSGTIRLLTVGSLTEKKDQAVLIRAMKELPSEFTLTLVGEGVQEQQLKNLVDELEVRDRVQFAGRVPHAHMRHIYENHDLFVLPSKREGCPNVVSEAQAAGLAVVAFVIPGMSEFVSHKSGVLVNERTPQALAEGICKAASVQKEMGSLGYEEVRTTRSSQTHIQMLKLLLNN